jgi:serralysin
LAALDVGPDSTVNASAISDTIKITLTGNSIAFEDTLSGSVTIWLDSDLSSGSFSQFVQFTGNDADNTVSGSVGLNGAGYSGGSGNDTFRDDGAIGGRLSGGDGNDHLTGGIGNNNIDGGAGDDILRGGGGNNNLLGGKGNDTLFADDGSGNLDGGDGDDVLYAGLNTTFVQGGDGTDTLLLPDGATFTPFSPGSTGGTVTLPNGKNFTYLNISNVAIACFTPGTFVKTPRGDVAVEDLEIGDLVDTLDHGPQPIRWIGKQTVSGTGVHAPIRFMPDSIGNTRSLRLSPQHRVLLSGWKCEMLFETSQVLCAAKHMCDNDRIFREPCDTVTYIHFMFDRHEIIFADGALLESFFIGDYVTDEEFGCYAELTDIFPELTLRGSGAMRTARPCLKSYEASLLF